MRTHLFLMASLSLLACSRSEEPKRPFRLPVVVSIQEPDSLRKFEVEHIVPNSALMIGGTFPFMDTINFLTGLPKPSVKPFEAYKTSLPYDSLAGDGLEIYPDYTSNVYLPFRRSNPGTLHYPVYLVNQSPQAKVLHGGDAYVFTVQEAQDSNGLWYPIESRVYGACSSWWIQFDPQHFVILLLPKYKGSFKTKLRVRLENHEQIYVSQPFEGWIDPQQFKFERHYPFLNRPSLLHLSQREFLGAIPKEAEDEEEFILKIKKKYGR